MSTHAPLSPSAAHRWTRCPGSRREEAKYPDSSSEAAIDGTHSHTLLEYCLKFGAHPTKTIGANLADDDGEFVVDKERAERVNVAVDYVKSILNESRVLGCTSQLFTETRVDPAHLIGRTDMSGTVDIRIIEDDTLHVIDYKDGMNPVEAEGNEQLELYALGALAEYKLPINGTYPVRQVTMTIIQPKLALRGMNPITSHTMSVQQVLSLIGKYALAGSKTDAPDAPLVPGPKQCKYCKATGCAARASSVMASAGVVFPVVAVDSAIQVAQQDPTTMSPDRLREMLEAAPLIRQALEAAEAEALRRMEAGEILPGLKLVNGRGSQAWTLSEDEIAEKLKGMGVPKDAIYKTSVVSPAQAKKMSWEKRDGTKKTLSDRQLKTLETEYIVKLGGKLTVAPESDPRPAVVRNAAPMFSAVTPPVEQTSLPAWLM